VNSQQKVTEPKFQKLEVERIYRLLDFGCYGQLVQCNCGITPQKLQQFWSLLFHVLWGPLHHQKSPRDSEWRISNYQGSKVKVSQSETRIHKWTNKRCTYRVWCQCVGNWP